MKICPRRETFIDRMKPRVLGLLMITALAWLGRPAAAEINAADSIEWATIDSDLVVRGVVTGVTERKGPGQVVWSDATVRVDEMVKGAPRATVVVTFRDLNGNSPPDWRRPKAELLLFLVDTKRLVGEDPDYAGTPFTQAFGLRDSRGSFRSVLDLAAAKAYTAGFDLLVKRDAILAAVRGSAKSTAKESHRLDAPSSSPAGQDLWSGSTVWLYVPVDAALEKQALRWIAGPDAGEREQGVRALAHFFSSGNTTALLRLLADPGFVTMSNGKGPKAKRFVVRAAAHEVLTEWRVKHKPPVLETKL
jgi:hypothetical protein